MKSVNCDVCLDWQCQFGVIRPKERDKQLLDYSIMVGEIISYLFLLLGQLKLPNLCPNNPPSSSLSTDLS